MNSPIDIGVRVDQYVKLRDRIKQLDEEHKDKMKPYRETLEKLNSDLLSRLAAVGAENIQTAAGTVYKTEKKSASVADRNSFWTYVVATGNWDLLDWKANVTAVEEHINEQIDAAKANPAITPSPPPGVNYSSTFVVGVRRANNLK